VYVIEIIVFRAKNLRDLALVKRMAGSSGEPINKLFLVPWRVLLITLSNNQSIGISESSAAPFIVYSNDICDCDNRIIRISKVKLGAILQIGSLIRSVPWSTDHPKIKNSHYLSYYYVKTAKSRSN
jgi:hypothetical protein